jgi:hypothetical protein
MSTAQDRTTRIKFLISEQNQPLPCCSRSTILDNYGLLEDISSNESYTLQTSQIAVNVTTTYTLGFGIAVDPVSGTAIYLQVISDIDGILYSTGPVSISASSYESFTSNVTLSAGTHTITLELLDTSNITGTILGGYLAMFRA